MFTRDRVHTSRERNIGRNNPDVHSVLAVYFFKGTSSQRDGVSTYLALTFGTLLSSQGTDASFVLTLSGFPPGASLRSCVSDSIRSFRSDFLGAFQSGAFALSFPAVPTLSDPFLGLTPSQRGLSFRPLRAVPTSETLADSPAPERIGGLVLSNGDSSFRKYTCQ